MILRKKSEKSGRFYGIPSEERQEASELILICLSDAPSNAKVITTAARMAEAFHGGLTALYVEDSSGRGEGPESGRRLKENIKLAEELGARIATVYGADPALQIAEYAKAAGVTRIVLGRTNMPDIPFLAKKSMTDRLMEMAPDIDIYIIPDKQKIYWSRPILGEEPVRLTAKDFAKVIAIEVAASAAGMLFYKAGLGQENIITMYILGVLVASIWTNGWIYGVITSLLSVAVFNFFFTEPRFTLAYYDAGYAVTFLVMLAASLATSSFTMRVKQQAKKEARKAYRTQVLLETSQMFQNMESADDVMKAAAEQLRKLLDRTIIFYPALQEGKLGKPQIFPVQSETGIKRYLTQEEAQAARWVFENNKHAGATTDAFPGSSCLYLAVRGQNEVLAVAGIAMEEEELKEKQGLETYEKNLMMAMLDECGLVLEKHQLDEKKREAEVKAEQEALRANLLRAISHDLRTPLTGIIGNAGILMERSVSLEEEKKHQLYEDIFDDASWLVNLVENLLYITRLENGTMDIHMEPELIDEVIYEALRHLDRKASEHMIEMEQEDDLMMAEMDVRLIVQVIINIVNNAIKYTPSGSLIRIKAIRRGNMAQISISDDGPGVSDKEKSHIFDMFYTANKTRGDSRRGLGLGLSLCRSIIDAHGGELSLSENEPHGAIFTFTLKIAEVNSYE